jgi:hypothetical protein
MCHRCHTRQSSRCTCAFWVRSEQISVLLPRLYPLEPDDQISSSTLETSRFPCSIPAWETTDPFPQTLTHVSRRAPAFTMVQGQLLTPSWSQRVWPKTSWAEAEPSARNIVSQRRTADPALLADWSFQTKDPIWTPKVVVLQPLGSLFFDPRTEVHPLLMTSTFRKENEIIQSETQQQRHNIFSHDVQLVWKIQTG